MDKGRAYLIRDRDSKFGPSFARVAATSGIKILKTPYQAPRANAICERFLGSVRRECLDHVLILQEKQLHRVLLAYVDYAQPSEAASRHQATDPRTIWGARFSRSPGRQDPRLASPEWITPRVPQKCLNSSVFPAEQMGAFCGALLIEELAYLRSFVPSCTEKDNHRERMALPCQNPEGNHGKLIRMTKLYSQERYSHEEVEEVIEEMKPSLFSAVVTSSQHKSKFRLTAAYPIVRLKMSESVLAQQAASTLQLALGHSSRDVSCDGNSSKLE
jgi:hypothetical protein